MNQRHPGTRPGDLETLNRHEDNRVRTSNRIVSALNTTSTRESDCLIIGGRLAGAAYSFFAAERGLSCILLSTGDEDTAANSDWAQGGIISAFDSRLRL